MKNTVEPIIARDSSAAVAAFPELQQIAPETALSSVVATTEFNYGSTELPITASYLAPVIVEICRDLAAQKILDLGCGNGAISTALARLGVELVGCDPCASGVKAAARRIPQGKFYEVGVYDDPADLPHDQFDVVEH